MDIETHTSVRVVQTLSYPATSGGLLTGPPQTMNGSVVKTFRALLITESGDTLELVIDAHSIGRLYDDSRSTTRGMA